MYSIAILGFGTVGGGVAEVLRCNKERIAQKLGQEVALRYILVRSDRKSEYAERMVRDFSVIENDPAVDVVVETIGGCTDAYEYTRRALLSGKHVVTANKELVAEHGEELLAIAREKNVNYLFEASVGGGIPILHPLMECLAANRIDSVYGILNGTTNYILTRMARGGADFAAALREAQEKGYAEADPTADVEGIDAGRKISILSALALGEQVPPSQVSMQGIRAIEAKDTAICCAMGYRIKLLGRAMRLEDGRICAYVAPHVIALENPMSTVDDVYNAITVHGNATGEVMFYGRGAGALPTASAVVSDVIEALEHRATRKEIKWSVCPSSVPSDEIAVRWYLRAEDMDALRRVLPQAELWESAAGCAAVTEAMTEKELARALQGCVVVSRLRML